MPLSVIKQIETVVLLFPNQNWSGVSSSSKSTPDFDSVVKQLPSDISYASEEADGLGSLSTHDADLDGTMSGFLYVPDLDQNNVCYEISKQYIPANVTRQANLPNNDFTLTAIAPWINANCTLSYMDAARLDPARSFIIYLPNGTSANADAWDLGDGGAWKNEYPFPVYTIPTALGTTLMDQLSLYSGNLTDVPFGHNLSELPGVDPRDYVRLYTQVTVFLEKDVPSFWILFVVVFVLLVVILGCTSAAMHLIQRYRRRSLRRRVESGEVNLEALGIKRLRVPIKFIEEYPVFVYTSEDDKRPSSLRKKYQNPSVSSAASDDYLKSSKLPEVCTTTMLPGSIRNTHPDMAHACSPYSQPTCSICLADFTPGISKVRELPCSHIFHPECIDLFLSTHSSLCPMCKKSALPIGYCPTKITNAMVRREKILRRLRTRVTTADDEDPEAGREVRQRIQNLRSKINFSLFRSSSPPRVSYPLSIQGQPVFVPSITKSTQPTTARSKDEDLQRQAVMEQRIRELAAGQLPIRDADLAIERRKPIWVTTILKAFPGF